MSLLTACTDTALVPIASNRDRVAVRGDFCTTEPEPGDYPVRVLFAIDSSDSMVFNDPANLHVESIENVVQRFRDDENVSFGILRWGERFIRETTKYNPLDGALFTKDETLLNDAFARMRQLPVNNTDKYLGGTDYEGALDEVRDYLMEDIAQNPQRSAMHRYYVEFLTDGMPQSNATSAQTTRDNIMLKIDALHRDLKARVDVVSIVEIATVSPVFFDLLPSMAETGGGAFIQLASPDTLDESMQQILANDLLLLEFDLATVSSPDEPRSVLVSNSNVRVAEVSGVVDTYVDSDGDGLVDAFEAELGTNPSHFDTDGDGLDDLFEYRHLGEYDPLARHSPPLSVELAMDVDRDGLIAFVEQRMGTDEEDADSDGDGVVDGLEFRAGTDPLVDDMSADADRDSVSNIFELRQHTDPRIGEGVELAESRQYEFETVGDPYQVLNGRRCYRFRVANIELAETLPATDASGVKRPRGFNRIEVWRTERAMARDGMPVPDIARVIPGESWVVYDAATGQRNPMALELQVREVHFAP